jgi:hypothetical protein
MTADRVTKVLLTLIVLELGWIAAGTLPVEVSAQRSEPMRVVIAGVEGEAGKEILLPVTIVGTTRPVRIATDRPIPIETPFPIRIEAERPIPVETTDRPLDVRTIPDPPALRPGL